MIRWLLIAALIAGAYHQLEPKLFGRQIAALSFTDLQGARHDLKEPKKTLALGFWFEDCPQSADVISVLNRLRESHSAESLEVLSFYLNPVDDAALAGHAAHMDVRVPVINAQAKPEQFGLLLQNLEMNGAAVYIIEKKGTIHTIPLGDTDADVLLQKAEETLKKTG